MSNKPKIDPASAYAQIVYLRKKLADEAFEAMTMECKDIPLEDERKKSKQHGMRDDK